MRMMSRRVLILQLFAVAIGTAVALGLGGGQMGDSIYAHGSHNCTRYAPGVAPGTSWWDDECTDPGTMAIYNAYQTPSWAWREHNHISLNQERWWEVGLFDINGTWYAYNAGTGFGGANSAVTSVQTRGHCAYGGTYNIQGFCFVNSHI